MLKMIFCEFLTHTDGLGRVVIRKKIRRTVRIREGDDLKCDVSGRLRGLY